MVQQALPVCVIGAGLIGMRHVQAALESPMVALTAIVESNPDHRAALALKGLPMVAGFEDIPIGTKAAIIATPTPNHHQMAIDLIGRGMGVLVEKPLTSTMAEAYSVVNAALTAGVPLITGHHRRCHPFMDAARARLVELGDIVGVQGIWSLRKHEAYFAPIWRRKAGAGPLMTNLSHEMDLLRFLIGDLSEVTAMTSAQQRGFEVEDTAAVAMRFDNGALGSFLISDAGASPWSFETGSFENPAIKGTGEDYIRITGSKGALEFPSLRLWRANYEGEVEWSKGLSAEKGQSFLSVDPIRSQLDRFAQIFEGVEDNILCDGAAGLAALQATLAAALSAKLARNVRCVDVPPDFQGI